MNSTTHNGHLTAISRKTLSTPVAYLVEHGFINGRVLDYGCGRGSDVELLRAMGNLEVEGFDPHYRPEMPAGWFDTITCNFVLNVIPDETERRIVLASIQNALKVGGTAYISVRNDKRSLKGWTSKKTWQGYVELPFEVVKKTAGFVMYKVTKVS